MSSEWSLIEYRPGRYVKVTSDGGFLGKATEAEVKAWFSAQAWLSPAIPQAAPAPDGAEPEIEDEAPGAEQVEAPAEPWQWFTAEPGSPAPLAASQEEEAKPEAEAALPSRTKVAISALVLEPEPAPLEAEDALPQFDVVLGTGESEAAIEPPSAPKAPEPEELTAQAKVDLDAAEPETAIEPPSAREAPEPEELTAQAKVDLDAAEPETARRLSSPHLHAKHPSPKS